MMDWGQGMIPPFRRQFDLAQDPVAAANALRVQPGVHVIGLDANKSGTGLVGQTWTPAVSFATPGDMSVTYSVQAGRYIQIGKFIVAWFQLQTSAFTHTTASGNLQISGMPTPASGFNFAGGIVDCSGLVPGGSFSTFGAEIASSLIQIITNDPVTPARGFIGVAHHTSGVNVILRGSIPYLAA